MVEGTGKRKAFYSLLHDMTFGSGFATDTYVPMCMCVCVCSIKQTHDLCFLDLDIPLLNACFIIENEPIRNLSTPSEGPNHTLEVFGF